MSSAPDEIDYKAAYASYVQRFAERFGERPVGAFVKFGRHMVQKLSESEFAPRLDAYVKLHRACKKMIDSGATISDALVLDFVEASAWIAVEAPNIHGMFRGELGDPSQHAPPRGKTAEHLVTEDVTDPGSPPEPADFAASDRPEHDGSTRPRR